MAVRRGSVLQDRAHPPRTCVSLTLSPTGSPRPRGCVARPKCGASRSDTHNSRIHEQQVAVVPSVPPPRSPSPLTAPGAEIQPPVSRPVCPFWPTPTTRAGSHRHMTRAWPTAAAGRSRDVGVGSQPSHFQHSRSRGWWLREEPSSRTDLRCPGCCAPLHVAPTRPHARAATTVPRNLGLSDGQERRAGRTPWR